MRRFPGLRFDRHEMAGSFADLGLMIPLAIGVSSAAGLDLAVVCLAVALAYATSAFAFRLPVPVQPMKAMAATVIAMQVPASTVRAAALEIGALFLLLAATKATRPLAALFPAPVVRGIQLAIGLLMVKSAFIMANASHAIPGARHLEVGPLNVGAGLVLAVVIGVVMMRSADRGRVPTGLVVAGAGVAIGIATLLAGHAPAAETAQGTFAGLFSVPSGHDFSVAFFLLVVPQIPLSLGNAVFSTQDALHTYYGDQAGRATSRRLTTSMGAIDLVVGAVGAMPLCHGAGGVTAHYRFGARTAGAPLLAALLFAGLAGLATAGVSPLLIPGAVLGGMLLFVGIEHGLLVTQLRTVDGAATALFIAGVSLATGDLAVAFLAGSALYVVLRRTPLRDLGLSWGRVPRLLHAARS